MRLFYIPRAGFRISFVRLVFLAVVTGCSSESFRSESGSGFKVGIVVAPVARRIGGPLGGPLGGPARLRRVASNRQTLVE